jgi:hypothetical protein
VDLAAQQHLFLAGVPERVVRLRLLKLLVAVRGLARIAGVLRQRLLRPIGQIGKARGRLDVPREIERKFAADDQFLQELVGDQIVFLCVAFGRQRDLERRDLAEVQVGAQPGGRVRGRLVALAGVAPQVPFKEDVQSLLRGEPAAGESDRRSNRVVNLAGGDQRRDRARGHRGVPGRERPIPSTRHLDGRAGLQVLRQQLSDLGTDRVSRVLALLQPVHGHDATRIDNLVEHIQFRGNRGVVTSPRRTLGNRRRRRRRRSPPAGRGRHSDRTRAGAGRSSSRCRVL